MKPRIQAKGFHLYRGQEKWLAKGVTYGPFAPAPHGDNYPETEQLREDFAAISAMGATALRLYDLPRERVATAAAEYDLQLFVDVPWPKHLDVYNDTALRRMCLKTVEEVATNIRGWENVAGLILGNEIPADLVRWHGAGKVERFIREMYDHAKTLAPDLLLGFANYPSTEYLELDFLDFVGFNVYLDDAEIFRNYLVRLRHLYPDKPLLLSECGLDSRDNGHNQQQELLPEFLKAAYETGLAGAFVFAWTDEWHTGGAEITRWDFGLVDRQRNPKPVLYPVADMFRSAPQKRKVSAKISVVIATYNGGRTLRQCLESVARLNYPNFETIVVDDGSTDDTASILESFPDVTVISQPNRGLSEARNAGIEAATGDIVAFTDSDCVVDRDWLYFIALYLEDNPELAGVGGPNITPLEDNLIQKAVALAPGHATHVLITQTEAEHVPGCNMAFWRDALVAVNGFDPIYHKAGDDVDIIWRLQDLGYSIGFSTSAFVWHHRRPTVKGYLKQQWGYGEAETLLLRKHPQRFNDRGQSLWRGIVYPSHSAQDFMSGSRVQYGVFGTAGYQCIYNTAPSLWWYYLTSVEWWAVCLVLILAGLFSPAALIAGIAGMLFSMGLSGIGVAGSWPGSRDYPKQTFPLVWLLWIIHPIVRSGARYWHRLRLLPRPEKTETRVVAPRKISGATLRRYWCQEPGLWRVDILRKLEEQMLALQWVCAPNDIWDKWDISIVLSPLFKVQVYSAEECFGGSKRMCRFRYRLVPSSLLYILIIGGLAATLLIALYDNILARWSLTAMLCFLWWSYRMASRGRQEVAMLTDNLITREGYYRVEEKSTEAAPAKPDTQTSAAVPGLSESRETENV